MTYLDQDIDRPTAARDSAARFERSSPRRTHGDRSAPWYWRMPGRPEVDVAHITEVAEPWREYHETFTICNVVSGPPVEWRCGNARYTRAVDRLMLVGPGDLHLDTAACASSSFQILRLPRCLVEASAGDHGSPSGPTVPVSRETRDENLLVAVTMFHTAARAGGGCESLEPLLKQVLRALRGLCRLGDNGPTSEHVALRRAREHMRTHLASPLPLDEVATVARMSKFRLVRVFRHYLGCAPHQYHVYMRVARARYLLAKGRLCGEVACEVGFTDQSHLNRWFVRLFGLSPGAYRLLRVEGTADAPHALVNRHRPGANDMAGSIRSASPLLGSAGARHSPLSRTTSTSARLSLSSP
jgi:AraC-like DNA-binding protein